MFAFDDFELDEGLFELRRGGQRVALRPQALDVLLHLVRHRKRVVTKDELLSQIWSGATVSETALPKAILAARRALGDEGEDPRFIQTIRARGYRFIGDAGAANANARAAAIASVSPPSTMTSLATLPFVGRDEIVTRTRAIVSRAAGGEGGVMLVGGAVGSGKTRALLEIGALARDSGATVVVGRCYDDEGVPALWPWFAVFRALAAIDADLAAPALEGLVANASDGRFTTFDVATRVLLDFARKAPLVVVIDDLHWADPASLLLTKLLAQSLRASRGLLVASHRDALAESRVLARTVGALAREDPARCLVLEPLGRSAIAELGCAALGHDLDASALARLENKTAGSPLFLTQILHAMRSNERLKALEQGSTSALVAADTMREAVTLHLSELGDACTRVLTAASVLERDFSVPALARMTGESEGAVLAALDEAMGKKIIRRAEGSAALVFVHELVRDVVYKRLGIAKRASFHEAASAALTELGDARGAEHHRARAASLNGE